MRFGPTKGQGSESIWVDSINKKLEIGNKKSPETRLNSTKGPGSEIKIKLIQKPWGSGWQRGPGPRKY